MCESEYKNLVLINAMTCQSFSCLHAQSMDVDEDWNYTFDPKPLWIPQHVRLLEYCAHM